MPRTIAEGARRGPPQYPHARRPPSARRAVHTLRFLTRAAFPARVRPGAARLSAARDFARARARAASVAFQTPHFFARSANARARRASRRRIARLRALPPRFTVGLADDEPGAKGGEFEALAYGRPARGSDMHTVSRRWGEADRGRNPNCHPRGLRGGRGRCESSGAHPRDLTRRAELFPLYLSQTTITNNNNNSRMTTSSASRTPLTRAAHGATTTTTTATATTAAARSPRRASRR